MATSSKPCSGLRRCGRFNAALSTAFAAAAHRALMMPLFCCCWARQLSAQAPWRFPSFHLFCVQEVVRAALVPGHVLPDALRVSGVLIRLRTRLPCAHACAQVVNERVSPACKARMTVENDDRASLYRWGSGRAAVSWSYWTCSCVLPRVP